MEPTKVVNYYKDSCKENEAWYLKGKLHRVDGPAFVLYNKSGNIQYEAWYFNRKRHRVDGPAYIWYYESGQIEQEDWYINGNQLNDKIIEYKEWLIDNNLYNKLYNIWTDEEKILWKLTWLY